ncbi:hypothetical protein UFOVP1244_45 [uncultured Caudovirales phage]|uniref:Uncharacterized protein n=1 Tax=uncultured Caudovirales phage TaxID=2100421 RepID=A0A6J5RG24_9CAUD|nr:hypothetical protein UFOVP1244_45 [uncultured Caudovirales phage]
MPIASALQKALEDAQAQSLSSNRQVWIWKAGDKYIPTLGDKPEGSSLMGRVIGEEGVKPQLYAGAAGVVGGGGLVSPASQPQAQAAQPPLTLDDVQKRISELQAQQKQAVPAAPDQTAAPAQGPAPLTIDAVQARIAELEAKNKPSAAGVAGDIATQVAHGLGRGVASIPGIPGSIQDLTAKASGLLPDWLGKGLGDSPLGAVKLPGSPETIGWAERNVIGARPVPQTAAGRYAGNVAEYLPPSAIGGPTGLAGRLGFGLASGLASEGAKEAGAPPLVQALAGLSPGIAAGGAKIAMHQFGPAASIRTATEGIGPEQWQKGTVLSQAGQEAGIPLMGHEALSPEVGQGPLGMLATKMSGTYSGGPLIRGVIEQRPAQVSQAVQKEIGKLGPSSTVEDVLSRTKDVMNSAIKDAEAHRTELTKGLYDAAGQMPIPESAISPIIDTISSKIDEVGPKTGLGKELASIRNKLFDNTGETPSIETKTSRLQTVYKELRDSLNMPPDAGGAQRSHVGVLSPIAGQIRDTLAENNPYFAKADALYKEASAPVVRLYGTSEEPGIARKIAEAKSPSQLKDLMINPDNVSPDTVHTIADIFGSQGRSKDLSSWLGHYLENSFNKASTDVTTGKNPALGANWRNAIYGNPRQREVLNAYYSEIDPTGKAGEGFQNLMQVLEKTGKTQLSATQSQKKSIGQFIASEELPSLAGLGAGSAALYTGKSPIVAAGWYLTGNALQNFVTKVLPKLPSKTIARNLTAPDSVERLKALAGKEPLSSGAAASVLSILGTR